MKIKEIFIDGFGRFNQKSFEPLKSPVVIMFGPNEAGKSTLLNFVRTILFGFPLRNSAHHYPALNGGRHGGNIVVTADDGSEYNVERYIGSKGGEVSITDRQTGERFPQTLLSQICGHASKDVFNNIFAFTIDELQQTDLLEDKNINSQIYSVGMGTRDLPDLMKTIKSEMDVLYKPRGSKQKVNAIVRELEKIDEDITKLTLDSDRYSDLEDEVTEIDKKIAESTSRSSVLQMKLNRLNSKLNVWDSWVRLTSVERNLSNKKEYRGFPEQPMGELKNRLDDIRTKENEERISKEDLDKAIIDSDSVNPDFEITENEDKIYEINQKRSSVLESINDLPERKLEMDLENELVEKRLSSLGKEWDVERLSETDLCSHPISVEISEFRDKYSSVQQKLSITQNSYEESEVHALSAKNLLRQKREIIDQTDSPKYTKENLDQRISLPRKINEIYRSYKSVSSLISNDVPPIKGTIKGGFKASPWFKLLTCTVILILVLLTGVLSGQSVLFSTVLSVFLSIGFWSVMTYIGGRNGSNGVTAIKEKLDGQIKDYISDINELFDELGLQLPNLDQIDGILEDVEKENLKHLAQIEDQDKAKRSFTDAEKLWQDKKALVDHNRNKFDEMQEGKKEIEKSWKQWLVENRLSSSLTPGSMIEYLQKIEIGKKELQTAIGKQYRYNAVEKDINEYIDLIKPIADKHGENYEIEDPKYLVTIADKLFRRLESSKEQAFLKNQYIAERDKCENSYKKRVQELTEARNSLKSLLMKSGVNSEQEYRQMAKDFEETQRLEQEKEKLDQILSIRSGPGEELLLFKKELADSSFDKMESDYPQNKRDHDQQISHRDQLIEQRGRLRRDIDQLFKEDKLSELRASRIELVEQLSDQVRKWTKFKLAESMLNRGIEKYETESQPTLIKNAGQFFDNMTEGKYPKLVLPLGEDRSISIRDESESSKNPDQLSRGTREQLYLSLRLALIKEYLIRSESLPIIIDEIFVNFDPSRAAKACSSLAQMSVTNQILVFTCHPEMVSLFQKNMEDVQVIEIS